jgi:cobyrinic acid a,c-diamide synthase
MDLEGNTSTSELAKLLRSPVVLAIDCTKSTRTVAALVLGCRHFDPNVMIQGVILNRIAGSRHESILRKTIEHYAGVKVLGAIPKLKRAIFPERHMGLIPTQESPEAHHSIQTATEIAEQYLDSDALLDIAHKAPPLAWNNKSPAGECLPGRTVKSEESLRIGIVRDSAFQFYYPENFEALTLRGAELVPMSALSDPHVPDIDGLYIGGGFPETHAKALASNQSFRENLRQLAESGLPIYAECGGLMYLGEELLMDEKSYPMVGLLPIVFGFSRRPQAHGYTVIEVDRQNPYFEVGTKLRGHEFHYSKVLEWHGKAQDLTFRVERGTGLVDKRDGVCYKNILATYTHIHALGFPCWADGIVRRSWENKQKGIF